MAESDPKKIRPFGQSFERRTPEGDEDPLVELARIVSEDNSFYGSRGERGKPAREEPIDRNAYSADLESELLHELESSFAAPARTAPPPRSNPPPPAAVRTPSPSPQTPAAGAASDGSDDLLRSIEQQLGDFERRNQRSAAPAPTAARQPEPDWEQPAESQPRYSEDAYDIAPEPPEEPPVRRVSPDRAVAEARERIARVRASEVPERSARLSQARTESQERPEPRAGRLAPIVPERERPRVEEPREMARLPLRRRDQPGHPQYDEAPVRAGFAAGAATDWDGRSDEAEAQPSHAENWDASDADYRSELRTTFGGIEETRAPARPSSARPFPVQAELSGELEPD